MSQYKELGKITSARYGLGGYQDCELGLSIQMGSSAGWSVGSFHKHETSAPFLRDLLSKSNRLSVADLVGVPVEVTLDGNALSSWRVLEEVL